MTVPEKYWKKKKVFVVLDDSIDSYENKIKLMKKAKNDILFHADIEEISSDFQSIDCETI